MFLMAMIPSLVQVQGMENHSCSKVFHWLPTDHKNMQCSGLSSLLVVHMNLISLVCSMTGATSCVSVFQCFFSLFTKSLTAS